MHAVKEDMLLVLDISSSKVTCRGVAIVSTYCLIALSAHTESEMSHAANDITGMVEKHVFGKVVRMVPVFYWFGAQH